MKKALITGASGGIGSACAKALAADGYVVMLHYYSNKEEAEKLAEEIKADGGLAGIIYADLSKGEDTKAMCEEVTRQLGSVDVLVNCAGTAHRDLIQDFSEEDWDYLADTDLKSVYMVSKYLIPAMISRERGCIINISSIIGVYGSSYESAYAAAKGGINSLTKAMAKELGPSGIRVNAIAPGCIDTKMLAPLDADAKENLIYRTPLGRMGTPEDVANLVSFLASEKASFITGQIIGIDGGLIL